MTILGTNYATPKGKTSLILGLFPTQYFPVPTFSFSDGKVTVEENTSHKIAQPFVVYGARTYDSAGEPAVQQNYALLHHDFAAHSVYPCQVYNYNIGSNAVSNPWLTNYGGVIAGVWQTYQGEIYAVTFKQGVYDYSATWFDNCSNVWTFDFKTPQVFKTNKKLSQVIDDFIF